MKKLFTPTVLILLAILLYSSRFTIIKSIYKYAYKDSLEFKESNYSNKNYEFAYLKKTDKFTPKNKRDLINIFYTLIDSDTDNYVIFCDEEYTSCANDAEDIMNSNLLLTTINTFVHPYNEYSEIQMTSPDDTVINLNIHRLYTDEEIIYIEDKLNKIEKQIITDDMTIKEKIKKMHDYIADNTKYEDNILYAKANALLLYKRARCSAYTDLLSIYLYKLNIPNYRIASEKHIWNLLYIDNEWLHIDLTWDDPVLSNGKDKTLHDFFLITTKKLEELDPIDKDTNTSSHTYNKEIYKEAN